MLMYGRDNQNIVKQLFSNLKKITLIQHHWHLVVWIMSTDTDYALHKCVAFLEPLIPFSLCSQFQKAVHSFFGNSYFVEFLLLSSFLFLYVDIVSSQWLFRRWNKGLMSSLFFFFHVISLPGKTFINLSTFLLVTLQWTWVCFKMHAGSKIKHSTLSAEHSENPTSKELRPMILQCDDSLWLF